MNNYSNARQCHNLNLAFFLISLISPNKQFIALSDRKYKGDMNWICRETKKERQQERKEGMKIGR
jgi:hypothetical protein